MSEDSQRALGRMLVLEVGRVSRKLPQSPAPSCAGAATSRQPTRRRPMRCARNSAASTSAVKVVIGEGEMDEAPMLYIGEEVGTGEGPEVDIAVDPLEGTTICAKSMPNALAVLAISERGGLLHAPDMYMDKIAVGPGLARRRGRPRQVGDGKPEGFGGSPRQAGRRGHSLYPGQAAPCRPDTKRCVTPAPQCN